MEHVQFLRIKKLTGKNIIAVAARHNLRELQAEIGGAGHIDPARTADNYLLRGEATAAGVAGYANHLLSEAALSRPLRKDAVRSLEIVFSLPPGSAIGHRRYFEDASKWAEKYFQAPVLSVVVHLDEAAPHCHVLLLPLVNGRMVGSDMLGNRARLQTMQADFHVNVGLGYGLTRQTAPKRISAALRRQAAFMVLETIGANPSRLNKASIRQAMVDAIAHDPEPLLMALGLYMPTPAKSASFVEIMTRPCKPEKKTNPIGFVATAGHEKDQTLSCVGFTLPNQPIPASAPSTPPAKLATFTREHDTDNLAGSWDTDTGEFVRRPVKQRSTSPAIEAARFFIASRSRNGKRCGATA